MIRQQIEDLLPYHDFAISEDCFEQDWCENYAPFIERDKAVFAAEYSETGIRPEQYCPLALQLNISAIYKNRELDAFVEHCEK